MLGDMVKLAATPRRSLAGLAAAAVTLLASQSVEAAEPKVPAGKDPGGIAIALIGGGVDYTSEKIAARLARDGEGELIGWDVVDDDRKPFAAPTAANPSPTEASAAGGIDATATADALLSAYAKARLVPVRAPSGDPQALAKAIAFAAGTPARIVAIAVPVETDLMRTVVRQASERFKNQLFIIAGAKPSLPGNSAVPPENAGRPSPPSVMNLPNVLVVLAAVDVEGRSAKDVVAAAEMVVMARGGSMFGAMPGAPPRNAGEAVALAAASAACQSHGITELLGSAAKAAAIDASRPLDDNRAIRVLDPMCWYGGKRM